MSIQPNHLQIQNDIAYLIALGAPDHTVHALSQVNKIFREVISQTPALLEKKQNYEQLLAKISSPGLRKIRVLLDEGAISGSQLTSINEHSSLMNLSLILRHTLLKPDYNPMLSWNENQIKLEGHANYIQATRQLSSEKRTALDKIVELAAKERLNIVAGMNIADYASEVAAWPKDQHQVQAKKRIESILRTQGPDALERAMNTCPTL